MEVSQAVVLEALSHLLFQILEQAIEPQQSLGVVLVGRHPHLIVKVFQKHLVHLLVGEPF